MRKFDMSKAIITVETGPEVEKKLERDLKYAKATPEERMQMAFEEARQYDEMIEKMIQGE